MRVTAQGFLTFVTYGVGMFSGSLLSGFALDSFTTVVNGKEVHQWTTFWLCSAIGSAAILLMVALLFQSRTRIRTRA